jgi:hypothetical protein
MAIMKHDPAAAIKVSLNPRMVHLAISNLQSERSKPKSGT